MIPRVLIQYWHDLGALPDDVEECINSWEPLQNNGFSRQLFDDEHARAFIEESFGPEQLRAFDRCYHPAMRCDYFRLCYIFKCGGTYVDADEIYQGVGPEIVLVEDKLKIQPLCYDIPTNQMIEPEEFLLDTADRPDRIFYVNNNPIISPAGHEVIRLALERSTRLLLQGSERPEIQSTTGPGNLSASLVRHVINLKQNHGNWDFLLLPSWKQVSLCKWFLSYRNDEKNWRFLNKR